MTAFLSRLISFKASHSRSAMLSAVGKSKRGVTSYSSAGKVPLGAARLGSRRAESSMSTSSSTKSLDKDVMEVYSLRLEGFGKRLDDFTKRLSQNEFSFIALLGFLFGSFYFTRDNSSFDRNDSRFEKLNSKIDSKFEKMDSKFQALQSDMHELSQRSSKEFDLLNQKIDKLYAASIGSSSNKSNK